MRIVKKILIYLSVAFFVMVVTRLIYVAIQQNSEQDYHNNIPRTIKLWSDDFRNNESMPIECTGLGGDKSPSLNWSSLPQGTQSLAIIAVDYDAPAQYFRGMTIDHWIVYNLPPNINRLNKGVKSYELKALGAELAKNISGSDEYVGPNPPIGEHRYYFRIYALSAPSLKLETPNKYGLMEAMKHYVLAYGELVGKYRK
jgi:Raf kinase inhibitor-like YbhB/YbcL family protein